MKKLKLLSILFSCFSVGAFATLNTENPQDALKAKLNEITVSLQILDGLNGSSVSFKPETSSNLIEAEQYIFSHEPSSFDWERTDTSRGRIVRDYTVRLTYFNESHTEMLMSLINRWLEEGFTVETSKIVDDTNFPKYVTSIQYRLIK